MPRVQEVPRVSKEKVAVAVAAALCLGVPVAVLLCAPAVAVRIAVTGRDLDARVVFEWGSVAAAALALLLVRLTAARDGRLRGGRAPWLRLPLAAGLVLVAANATAYLLMVRGDHPGVVVPGFLSVYGPAALAAAAALAAVRLWDRHGGGSSGGAERGPVRLGRDAGHAPEVRP
ncbi:hypothetical protein [Dactylosporangium sp. CA-233914]|uniref:hypothetical protein n=1 Tax=Dactylosporangium sp. CA-233914 TaxID=3239934 RepID=UPI003D8C8B05